VDVILLFVLSIKRDALTQFPGEHIQVYSKVVLYDHPLLLLRSECAAKSPGWKVNLRHLTYMYIPTTSLQCHAVECPRKEIQSIALRSSSIRSHESEYKPLGCNQYISRKVDAFHCLPAVRLDR